ncbi:Glycosyl hydrolase [Taphrina deformans PYCC 5710]|uniref:Glycosyl hydrolase n=1 Tax=Taphrina deformans (strain PYCC 5710 / ATCC 11124 / CBS 356.35 / IMI 108563 / JCM 9778 / NBRC 8474) TaxID=1097556 RepID=R4X862_TAPDE|nr:Glycosyl hydrolase [Taphrina deformans PYCC 5710]|eukprot:CCG81714.1 Glycosyl hydrolase [Taphrina deformans PYCC 5710]
MSKGFTDVNQTATSSSENLSQQKEFSANGNSLDSATRRQKRKRTLLVVGVVAGVVILALALGLGLGLGRKHEITAPKYPSENYALVEQYQGTDFFNKFDYWSDADPTNGFTLYQLRANSQYENYTYASSTSAIIRPDTNATATGVNSVRIQSTKNYTQGLFVLDLAHMPHGCGTWPAFWTCDTDNWPTHGEIDIMEGVNLNTHNQMTLHTSDGCTMKNVARNETGAVLTKDCHSGAGATSGAGCGVNDTTHAALSYGAGFNANGGGFYAMDWRSTGIRVWFFPRTALPSDLQVLSDDPTSTAVPTMQNWGQAVANYPAGNCDIDSHFKNHKIIFDLTFCGDWAGAASSWNTTTCYDATTAPTCAKYMANSPSDLADAYFEIKSLNVYQYSGEGASVVGSEYYASSSTSATVQVASSTARTGAAASARS